MDSEDDNDGIDEWDPTELDGPFENDTEHMDIGDLDLENDHEEDEGFTTDDCDGGRQVVAVRDAKTAVLFYLISIPIDVTKDAILKVAAAKAAKEAAAKKAAEMVAAAKAAKDAAAREAANEAAAQIAAAKALAAAKAKEDAAAAKKAAAAKAKDAAAAKKAAAAKVKEEAAAKKAAAAKVKEEAAADRAAAIKAKKAAAAKAKEEEAAAAAAKAKEEAVAKKAAAAKAKKPTPAKAKKEAAAKKAAAAKAKKDAAAERAASAKEATAKTKATQAAGAKAKTVTIDPTDGPLPSRTIFKAGTLIKHHDPDQVRAANAIAPKIARMLERAVKKAQDSTECMAAATEDDIETNDIDRAEVIDKDAPSDPVRYTLYLDISIDFFTGR